VQLRQFVDSDLGCASYLIADEATGEAALVDPAYHIAPYLDEVERRDLTLTCVLETHTHADHLSGHGRLAIDYELPVAIHRAAGVAYPHRALVDGDHVPVGSLSVRVLHSPGHRPEHCCFLIEDAFLTGDSLFVGSVARPDLAVEAREGAEGLFHSLRRMLELPDGVRVFPGHLAGSLCGTHLSSDPSSTIGRERRVNAALAIATVEAFIDEVAGVTTPRPPNMDRIVELNRGPFLGAPTPLGSVGDAGGATVLDVRSAEAFAAGHVPGSINVPVSGGSFGTRVGFLLEPGEELVLVAVSTEEAELAARRLHAVGVFELVGRLTGGDLSEGVEPVELDELERLLAADAVELLDVRELDERNAGYIDGTRHVPYRLVRKSASTLPDDRPIVTICESGARAGIAASILAAAGLDARPLLRAGIPDLEARGHRVVALQQSR
jgi:glyoxylase-like metal-dependent hydrolase (beta-lactamase superfamily II)/rhodanese-related sulfurtransferase